MWQRVPYDGNPTQEVLGQKIFDLAAELFPICRSITGDGVRQTLQMLRRHIDLSIHDVPTGTPVFDWSIPPEWNIRDAYIADEQGDRIVDFKTSNLHVLNYSAPVHTKLPLEELKRHIFTLPERPDLIPYRTSYYVERWGFCMSQNQLDGLEPGPAQHFGNRAAALQRFDIAFASPAVDMAAQDKAISISDPVFWQRLSPHQRCDHNSSGSEPVSGAELRLQWRK